MDRPKTGRIDRIDLRGKITKITVSIKGGGGGGGLELAQILHS